MKLVTTLVIAVALLTTIISVRIYLAGSIFGCNGDVHITKTVSPPSEAWTAAIEKRECSSALSGIYYSVLISKTGSSSHDVAIYFEPTNDDLDVIVVDDKKLLISLTQPEYIFHQKYNIDDINIKYQIKHIR